GVGRRFDLHELQLPRAKVLMVDDYAHHPNEVKALTEAAKKIWPEKRIVMAFQPHRYSRTKDCYDDFCRVLQMPDKLLLLNVYSAGEAPIEGVSSQNMLEQLLQNNQDVHLVSEDVHLQRILEQHLKDDDI